MTNETPSERPAFLLGAPRSGTSLVYKALCLHPEAAYISQWVQRYPQIPALACLDRIGRLSPRLQRQVWFPSGNAYAYGRSRSIGERLYPAPAEGESVFTRAGVSVALVEDTPPVGSEIERLRRAFRTIRRWNGGGVLIVKRIANNRRVPLLDAAFPEARFVEIVRDGRAVALSISKVDWWGRRPVWWLGRSPDEWAERGGDPLELTARHWMVELDTLEKAASDLAHERYLQVRYEDVVDDPIATLRTVARFVGLDPDDRDWLNRLGALDFPNKNQQWRERLTDVDIATIESVQGERLAAHGYDLLTADRD